MKRVIDPETGCSLAMRLEDRGADVTCILEYQGKRIEAKAGGIDADIARTAYAARDLEIFGQLIAPYDLPQLETNGQHLSGEAQRA
ncbi:MAG: hypothetical protein WC722_17715 [Rhodospirillales bacterium]|jgi:hypothetical protein